MIEIPGDLPLPRVCPRCGAAWIGYGTSTDNPSAIQLTCENWHTHHPKLTHEEVKRFRLAVESETPLSRPIWIVGEDHPVPNVQLPSELAEPGRTLNIDECRYVVEEVLVDRVWVRRAEVNPA